MKINVTLEGMLKCHCKKIVIGGSGNKGQVVEFHLPTGECVDMDGAIEVARMCLPTVHTIFTFAGSKRDTSYYRRKNGTWAVGRA